MPSINAMRGIGPDAARRLFAITCNKRWSGMVEEMRFNTERKWRFDMAWPSHLVACEIEGGIWAKGRHVRGTGYENDCRKYSTAAALGWRVIRVTYGMIESGEALELLGMALAIIEDEKRMRS